MSDPRPVILLLPRYGRLGASSRTRLWQYVPALEAAGFDVRVQPFFADDYIRDLQARRRSYRQIARAYLRRLAALMRAGRVGLMWIEKEAFPWLPLWLERLLLPKNAPVVLDYDDAVFQLYQGHRSGLVRRLLGRKHSGAMRRAALVIVGSRFLADYARAAGAAKVVQVPTVVDLDRYHRQRPRSGTAIPQVCWIGQQSTAAFLQPLAPMFAQLSRSGAMSFTAIGIDAAAASLPMDSVEWSEASEAAVIARCDIGIMPLPDTPFERGKCGYKLIQYMACGLPVVASPVGANRDIVEHGVNGFLVQTEGEWRDALLTLAADAELRRKMGEAGRIKVEQGFALQVASTEITALLAGLIRR